MVLFLFKGYAHQILFFLLAIILSIKKFIFGNDDEKDEDSKKIKEDMLNLTKRFEEIERNVWATNSGYDIINRMKNKPTQYRMIWDGNIKYYFIKSIFINFFCFKKIYN